MALRDYLGIPYLEHGTDGVGMSCWQLVEWYLREELNIHPPRYHHHGPLNTVGPVFMNHLDQWQRVPPENRTRGDLVMLRVAGQPIHCGVVVDHNTFLHTLKGMDSSVDRLNSVQWNKRIMGFWRWRNE